MQLAVTLLRNYKIKLELAVDQFHDTHISRQEKLKRKPLARLKIKQILAIQNVTNINCQNESKVSVVMLFCVPFMYWENVSSGISMST